MLPSVNGNFVGMVALLPGVISNISTESFGSDAISANGLDSRNNNFMLDGANNNDDVIGQRAGSQARTPLEAVAEFQVITNQYDAEFGRTTGAIINAISKSGTNAFHGVGGRAVAGRQPDAEGLLREAERAEQAGHAAADLSRQPGRPGRQGQGPLLLQRRARDDRSREHHHDPVAPGVQQLAGDAGPGLEHAGALRSSVERQPHLGGPLAAGVVAAAQSDRACRAARSPSP